MVSALVGFAQRIRWRIVWGRTAISDNPSMDAAEASAVASSAGSTLAASDIGNEPETTLARLSQRRMGASQYL